MEPGQVCVCVLSPPSPFSLEGPEGTARQQRVPEGLCFAGGALWVSSPGHRGRRHTWSCAELGGGSCLSLSPWIAALGAQL